MSAEKMGVVQMFQGSESLPAPVIETASEAAAAGARAEIEAAYLIAYKKPRNIDEVRVNLIKDCHRPAFAREAEYSKPIGGTSVKGLSIRAAEAGLRSMGNIRTSVMTIFEDATQSKIRISVTDLETNASFSGEITVQKTVERRTPRDGQEIVGQRQNTTGQTVFIIRASDDELQNKRNAFISKELRNLALRLIPGDLREEMLTTCRKTKADSAASDPDAEKKAIVDAFLSIGIRPLDLVAYIGHGLDAVQPAELVELRDMYSTIKDGEAKFADYLDQKKAAKKSADDTKPKKRVKQEAPAPTEQPPDDLDTSPTTGAPKSDDTSLTDKIREECILRDIPAGKLLTLLRQDELLTQLQTVDNLSDEDARAVLDTMKVYQERVQKMKG